MHYRRECTAGLVIGRALPILGVSLTIAFRKRRRLRDPERSRLQQEEFGLMDLNLLLHRHQVALMRQEKAANEEERRAFRQFAQDYSVRIRMTREEGGAPDAVTGFPT